MAALATAAIAVRYRGGSALAALLLWLLAMAGVASAKQMDYLGSWSSKTSYATGAVVSLDNELYYAKGANTNARPSPTSKYWQLISRSGLDAKGSWNKKTSYMAGAVVSYNGQSYASLRSGNVNRPPAAQPADWALLGRIGGSISSGLGAPPALAGVAGDFWIDVQNRVIYGPKTAQGWPRNGATMVGPKGDIGPPGKKGAQGKNGKTGEDGDDGTAPIGPKGERGGQGNPGKIGETGDRGDIGPPGPIYPAAGTRGNYSVTSTDFTLPDGATAVEQTIGPSGEAAVILSGDVTVTGGPCDFSFTVQALDTPAPARPPQPGSTLTVHGSHSATGLYVLTGLQAGKVSFQPAMRAAAGGSCNWSNASLIVVSQ